MGLDLDEMLSPSLLEKVSYVGTLLKSFRQGDVAIDKLLTGLKTRPGGVWNWADVVMVWLRLLMLSIRVRRFPAS